MNILAGYKTDDNTHPVVFMSLVADSQVTDSFIRDLNTAYASSNIGFCRLSGTTISSYVRLNYTTSTGDTSYANVGLSTVMRHCTSMTVVLSGTGLVAGALWLSSKFYGVDDIELPSGMTTDPDAPLALPRANTVVNLGRL